MKQLLRSCSVFSVCPAGNYMQHWLVNIARIPTTQGLGHSCRPPRHGVCKPVGPAGGWEPAFLTRPQVMLLLVWGSCLEHRCLRIWDAVCFVLIAFSFFLFLMV